MNSFERNTTVREKKLHNKKMADLPEDESVVKERSRDLTAWIQTKKSVPSLTDCHFVSAFLHTCKFEQKASQERVAKYWRHRSRGMLDVMNGLDPASPNVLNILRGQHAVYLPLPGHDEDGRKVIMAQWDHLDITGKTYDFKEWFRAITLIFDTLCFLDDHARVNGVTFLMDANNVSLKHVTFFGFDNSRKQFQVMQKGYPVRIKKVHYVNNNAAIEVLFNAVKAVLSKKLANRIQMHGHNLVPIYKAIGMANLPDEYLPDDYQGAYAGTTNQIMEQFIQEKILQPDNLKFLRRLYSCNRKHQMPDADDNDGHDSLDEDIDRLAI